LGYTEAVALLDDNPQEELATDAILTQLGDASANPKGAQKKIA
jgi:ferritin-like metal-binding protein YciE